MANHTGFKVTPAHMYSLADTLQGESRTIGTTLDTLESKVNTLRGQWDGDAQAAYDQAQRAWDQSAAHINAILLEMSKTTRAFGEQYEATDRAGRARFV